MLNRGQLPKWSCASIVLLCTQEETMKQNLTVRSVLALALAAGLACSTVAIAKPAAPAAKEAVKAESKTLVVGDKAPEIRVAKFVKGTPVTSFEKGKVYVVEFWATWCGPCKTSIPHLTELQKKHKDAVTMIGVSVWEQDQAAVQPFVEKMGDKMDYRVAMDDLTGGSKGFMAENWMTAAKQGGIPSAFIVDATGTIAWIGHPMGMEKPLQQIVDGKYDAKAAAAEAKAESEKEAKAEKEMEANQEAFASLNKAVRRKNFDEALKIISDLNTKAPSMKAQLDGMKTQIQGMQFKELLVGAKKDTAAAYKLAAELSDGPMKDDAMGLNTIAWTILDEDGVEKRDLDMALKLAMRAVELSKGESGMILDTLGRAYFEKGDLTKAVETQEKAVKHAEDDDTKDQLSEALAKYKKALADKK